MVVKDLVILGAGESGTGAAIFAQQKGWRVFVSDFGSIAPKYKALLDKYSIDWEENTHTIDRILQASTIIKSPGIPEKASVMIEVRKHPIEVISEIEFVFPFLNGKLIAVTGSNGKTTTTLLLDHMLRSVGLNVGLGGNIGQSAALQLAEGAKDVWLYEVSSFQLDDSFKFKPDIAIITNITPDHLDRYHYNFDEYIDSKFRITQSQTADDVFIYCNEDPVLQEQMLLRKSSFLPKTYSFGFAKKGIAWADSTSFFVKIDDNKFDMLIDDLKIKGRHNVYNSMAAAIAGLLMGLTKDQIRESFRTFNAVEHRLEEVLTIRGVLYINDSKATNINSTWYALESMNQPTVLILGGVDKGNDYSILEPLVREKVKSIICLGVDNVKIFEAFSGMCDIVETRTMQDAVQIAYISTNPGDAVLLKIEEFSLKMPFRNCKSVIKQKKRDFL
jgi:UDP-N-acetylmuramoylalanine--D-glutamate ligase